MKKKWLAIVPAIALATTPVHFQSVEAASEKEMVQMSEINPELKPILNVAPEHQPTLFHGSVSMEVELVQVKLNHFEFETDVDGIFGPQTDEKVRAFQADQGLVVDGVVGEKTWTALLAEERKDMFTVDYAVQIAEQALNNDDLVFSSDGVMHQDEEGRYFYSLKAQSKEMIENGGTGTVGFYDVYNDREVKESEPIE